MEMQTSPSTAEKAPETVSIFMPKGLFFCLCYGTIVVSMETKGVLDD